MFLWYFLLRYCINNFTFFIKIDDLLAVVCLHMNCCQTISKSGLIVLFSFTNMFLFYFNVSTTTLTFSEPLCHCLTRWRQFSCLLVTGLTNDEHFSSFISPSSPGGLYQIMSRILKSPQSCFVSEVVYLWNTWVKI